MSNAIAVLQKKLELPAPRNDGAAALSSIIDRIVPRFMGRVPVKQFCIALIAEANGLASDVDPKTVQIAGLHCALIGLVPGPALGHAYLIPYKIHGKKKCQCVPGYRGFLDLSFSNKFLRDVHPDLVTQQELDGGQFEYWIDEQGPRIRHRPALNRVLTRDNVAAAYCVYHTSGGGHGIALVTRPELDKIDTEKNVWESNYAAMARKTAIRRAAKEWKLTQQMAYAVTLDEQAEQGLDQELTGETIDLEPNSPGAFSLSDLDDPDEQGGAA